MSLIHVAEAGIWDPLCPSAWDSQEGCGQAWPPGAAILLRDPPETSTQTFQPALPGPGGARARHDATKRGRAEDVISSGQSQRHDRTIRD